MNPISIGLGGTGQQLLNSIRKNADQQITSIERLSTGKRINRPSDDPAGFVAADELRGELGDLQTKLGLIAGQRDQNQLRQSNLANIEYTLTSLRDKVLAANNDFLSADQKAELNSEVNDTIDALNRFAKQSGNDNLAGLGNTDAQSLENGDPAAPDAIATQSQAVVSSEAQLAADNHAQLDTFQNLYQDQVAITSEALSNIEDTDFAAETANFAKSQVLLQGAMAALSYASRAQADQIKHLLDRTA
jgi:flagellin